ncbi:Hypothetical predicted protein [Lecanosticta acicola]|uniref:Uncharacterized protein n=1 Tax=Lecanosticta acicola TaxID=111012 RepID=A0AAI8Z9F3_9PEZI|nr:Hypothetical predicted protein [Lecanosticta acicola]
MAPKTEEENTTREATSPHDIPEDIIAALVGLGHPAGSVDKRTATAAAETAKNGASLQEQSELMGYAKLVFDFLGKVGEQSFEYTPSTNEYPAYGRLMAYPWATSSAHNTPAHPQAPSSGAAPPGPSQPQGASNASTSSKDASAHQHQTGPANNMTASAACPPLADRIAQVLQDASMHLGEAASILRDVEDGMVERTLAGAPEMLALVQQQEFNVTSLAQFDQFVQVVGDIIVDLQARMERSRNVPESEKQPDVALADECIAHFQRVYQTVLDETERVMKKLEAGLDSLRSLEFELQVAKAEERAKKEAERQVTKAAREAEREPEL